MKRILIMFAILVSAVAIHFALTHDSRPFPKEHEIKGFNFVQQPDNITCGPTSTLMLLQRYGKDVSLDEVEDKTKTRWFNVSGKPFGMTIPEYVKSAVNHFGVDAKLVTGSIKKLKQQVGNDTPVIVLLRSSKTTWHYVVVIGYDKDDIIIANPSSGRKEMLSIKVFEGAWRFETDMEGLPVNDPCPDCNGSGWKLIGKLICTKCKGQGHSPDLLAQALRLADVYTYTMIVPTESIKGE